VEFTPHSAAGHLVTLSLAAPQCELRQAEENGIERKDGMYHLEQSSRRNESIIINADHRTGGGPRRLLLPFQLQLWLRRVHMQSAPFYLRLDLCLGFCFCLGFGFYFGFSGSLGNLDPCDARVRGCVCACALAVTGIAGLGLFTSRVRIGGSIGGYRRSILIVDRLYYRIICLGLFFLSLSLRCFAFLFLTFLLLYKKKGCRSAPDSHDVRTDAPPSLARALSLPFPS
jgi:hypothetical protein